jgi:Flp pilus assembly protein TadD
LELVHFRPVKQETALHVLLGLLVGFIAGYLVHEAMIIRQPARLVHGDASSPSTPSPAAAPSPAPPMGAGGRDPMAEIQQLRDQVAKNPDDAEAIVRLASMNYMIQKWDRAAELFERYLTLRPNGDQAADVMSDLGACYRGLQQPDKAIAMFDRVIAARPDHWQALYNKAYVLAFDLRRFDQADQILGTLRQMQPGNQEVEGLAAEVARLRTSPS